MLHVYCILLCVQDYLLDIILIEGIVINLVSVLLQTKWFPFWAKSEVLLHWYSNGFVHDHLVAMAMTLQEF